MTRTEAKRGPGRPARLSRESILEGALALLEREPAEPLSVARIAAEVDAVPAALYRHFASLDELLDGVLGQVLGSVELEIRRRAPWPEQIRDCPHLARLDGDAFFAFVTDRTLEALVAWVGAR